MRETQLLGASIQSKDAYTRLYRLGFGKEISDTSKVIWKELGEYYNVDSNAKYCDKELLAERLLSKYPSEVHRNKISQTLGNATTGSVANVLEVYRSFKTASLEEQLAVCISSGQRDKIPDLMHRWRSVQDISSEAYGTTLHKGIIFSEEEIEKFNPIKLYPDVINDWTDGGIEKGEQAIWNARPNIGKTAMALTIASGSARDGLRVLFLTNEESPRKTKIRFSQAFLVSTKERILANPQGAAQVIQSKGGDNFFFKELDGGGTFEEIERHIIECEPDVFVLDMMRHLRVRGNSKHEKLEEIARVCRDYAKKYDFASHLFTQAGDSAEGKRFLDKGDIDESNTGVPGACDLGIGIGADETQMGHDMRTLSFWKNKRGLDNTSCDVKLDRIHSRFI